MSRWTCETSLEGPDEAQVWLGHTMLCRGYEVTTLGLQMLSGTESPNTPQMTMQNSVGV